MPDARGRRGRRARPSSSIASRRSAAAGRGSPTRSSPSPTAPAARPRRRWSTRCSSTPSPATDRGAAGRRGHARRCRRRAAGVQHRLVRRVPAALPGRLDRAPRRPRHGQRPRRAGRPAGVAVGGLRHRGGLPDRRAARDRRRHGRGGAPRPACASSPATPRSSARAPPTACTSRPPGSGVIPAGRVARPRARPAGRRVLVSGTIGDHGMAVMLARGDLALEADIRSDTAPVDDLVEAPARCRAGTGGCATRPAAASARCATSWPRTPRRASCSTRRRCRSPRRSSERATCSASTRCTWPTRARSSRSSPPEEADAALAAMRAHPFGARGGRGRRDRRRARGHRRAAHHVRRHADRRHARRRPAAAHLLMDAAGAPPVPGHRHRAGGRLPALRLSPRRRARLVGVRAQRQRRRAHRRRGRRRTDRRAGPARCATMPPPLARVDAVRRRGRRAAPDGAGVRIVQSEDGGAPAVPVSIDTATCAAASPRSSIPPTVATATRSPTAPNCGPRYTIVLVRAVRPPGDDDGRLRDVPGLPGGVRRSRPTAASTPSPTPARCAARSVTWRDPAGTVVADGDAARRRRRRRVARRCGRGGEGRRRLPPRRRRDVEPMPSPSCGVARRATTSRSP